MNCICTYVFAAMSCDALARTCSIEFEHMLYCMFVMPYVQTCKHKHTHTHSKTFKHRIVYLLMHYSAGARNLYVSNAVAIIHFMLFFKCDNWRVFKESTHEPREHV